MSVIGDFAVPAESFALAHALDEIPELTVEADRLASHSSMEVMPFLWIAGSDVEHLREVLSADPSVNSTTVADEMDGEALFRITWAQEFCDLIDDMVDHHAGITRARAAHGQWSLRLRFAEEAMISEFQSHFDEEDRSFEVHSLTRPASPRGSEFGLTADQREALAVAARAGYFSIPRETSAEELGEYLGISANAASERVRRGTEALIDSGLMITDDDSPRRDETGANDGRDGDG